MLLIEEAYPTRNPLLPPSPQGRQRVQNLLRLERQLASAWLQWAGAPPPGRGGFWGGGGGGYEERFEKTMVQVDQALQESGGPFFLGEKARVTCNRDWVRDRVSWPGCRFCVRSSLRRLSFSFSLSHSLSHSFILFPVVAILPQFSFPDAVFAPFLERIAASTPFWKGLQVRGNPKWPRVNAWMDAMDNIPTYKAIKSDDFTITHTLEPQIGPVTLLPEGAAYRAKIEGKDDSWDLPLKPEQTAWGFDDGTGAGGAREEAAQALVSNHEAIVAFSMRAFRQQPADDREKAAQISAGFRHVAHALLEGVDAAGAPPSALDAAAVATAAVYLRDRVGVPRDLTYPAARQLRAHLQWLVRSLGSNA